MISTRMPPLVSVGKGSLRRDLHAHELCPKTGRDFPNFLIHEPWEHYHANSIDHVSSHSLANFRKSPAYFRRMQIGLASQVDTEWFHIGRALAKLTLEGRPAYQREYAVGGPINPATDKPYGSDTKKFREWASQQGRPVLAQDHALLVETMAAAIRAHPIAAGLITEGIAEGVIRQEYCGVRCQSRLDWYSSRNGIVDLKSTRDIDEFEHQIRQYGYINQLAFYRSMVALAAGTQPECRLIAVEKCEPFRVGVWQLGPVALYRATLENERDLCALAECRRADHWPTKYEDERLLEA